MAEDTAAVEFEPALHDLVGGGRMLSKRRRRSVHEIASESGLWVEGAAVPATSATAHSSSRERRRSHGRGRDERIVVKVVEPKGGGAIVH